MKISEHSSQFSDVLISSGVNFNDDRGQFKKTIFGDQVLEIMGDVKELLCVNSLKNVIRGLHFQLPPHATSKFLTCINGKILDVFLDIRQNSKNYGKFGVQILEEKDDKGLFIPKGYAHGYSVVSDKATVVYLQSENYNEDSDFGINPLSVGIDWGIDSPIISKKDSESVDFQDFITSFE